MRGLLHAHSRYSYDGEATLAQLADWGASRGLDFILLAEHANDFDEHKMTRYVGEVDALSGSRCRLVPGLEFAVRGGFHVLGFNVRRFERVIEPSDAVRFIRDQGGLAVLAHPARYRGQWPDAATLGAMHGIEVWNARYDGRFLPSGDLLDAARSAADGRPGMCFFGGQDLHRPSANRLVVTEVPATAAGDGLLDDLAGGRGRFGAPGVWLAASPTPLGLRLAGYRWGHRLYRLSKDLRDRFTG